MQLSPTIETRPEQSYAGIRKVMPMADFAREIPALMVRVSQWVAAKGLRPAGKPIPRFHVIDMPKRLDVEVGIPTETAPAADGEIMPNVLPAGRYAVTRFQGVKNAISANGGLLNWMAACGEQAASQDSPAGQAFDARYETYLTDAQSQPDPDAWQIEVAILLR